MQKTRARVHHVALNSHRVSKVKHGETACSRPGPSLMLLDFYKESKEKQSAGGLGQSALMLLEFSSKSKVKQSAGGLGQTAVLILEFPQKSQQKQDAGGQGQSALMLLAMASCVDLRGRARGGCRNLIFLQ